MKHPKNKSNQTKRKLVDEKLYKILNKIIIHLLLVFAINNSFGQSTPKELGEKVFNCFKLHSIDSLLRLKPTFNELAAFANAIGIDSSKKVFIDFKKRYPLVIEDFKKKFNNLLNDTSENQLSWKNAIIDNIEISQKIIPVDNRDPNSKTIILTIIDIYFTSNSKKYVLTIGDANNYNDVWKIGNNLDLSGQ